MILFGAYAVSCEEEPREDNPQMTSLWEGLNLGDLSRLESMMIQDPELYKRRSADGRGGLWWAFEYGNTQALSMFAAHDVDVFRFDVDNQGNYPEDMCNKPTCNIDQVKKALTPASIAASKQRLEDLRLQAEEEEEENDFSEEIEDIDEEL